MAVGNTTRTTDRPRVAGGLVQYGTRRRGGWAPLLGAVVWVCLPGAYVYAHASGGWAPSVKLTQALASDVAHVQTFDAWGERPELSGHATAQTQPFGVCRGSSEAGALASSADTDSANPAKAACGLHHGARVLASSREGAR